jgi:AcrR family transcriptional regulator
MAAGRRRSDTSRSAILEAALDIVTEPRDLSIEEIARRSGTGKQTVYRWWPSKAHVLLDVLAGLGDERVPAPATGDLAADLRVFLDATMRTAADPAVAAVLRALMAEALRDPDFAATFRSQFVERRRAVLHAILAAGADRLRPGLDPGIAADLVFGALWYRVLLTERLPDRPLADELVALLVPGDGPPTEPE